MKTGKEQELDDLFKAGLESTDMNTNFMEDDWEAMDAMLDKNKKRGIIIYWLPILGSVAAVLLLVLGFFLFKYNDAPAMAGLKPVKTPTHLQKNLTTDTVTHTPQQITAAQNSKNTRRNDAVTDNNIVMTYSKANKNKLVSTHTNEYTAGRYPTPKHYLRRNNSVTDQSNNVSNKPDQTVLTNDKNILAANLPQLEVGDMNRMLSANVNLPRVNKNTIAIANKYPKLNIKSNSFNRPGYTITVLASPDINGAGSFQDSKIGTNIGLLFSVGVSNKFTISTGASYSKKPYMTDFDNYHTNYTFITNPENVSADCRVLDIPINVDYQLYKKSRNMFSIGTGLSSYFMLKENYHYNYEYANTPGPTDYNISNRNQYIFGVLNLDATYQRQINSKFSLNIEPYLKVPLTNIGYSQVKLQSTGVAVGVSWNLHK